MKAILVDENKDLVWHDVPDPDIDSNEALVSTSIEAVLDAELPPIPPDVAGALKSESLTITMHFRIY